MAVRAAVLDVDGTLLKEGTAAPISGAREMVAALRQSGIRVVLASNRPGCQSRARSAGFDSDLFLGPTVGGAKKGSPLWVQEPCKQFNIQPNELVWLGDTDNDMRSAVNGKVPYFHATWSEPNYKYGIPVVTPEYFRLVLCECFAKQSYWYWRLSDKDLGGRPVEIRALMDSRGAGIPSFGNDLIRSLKDKSIRRVGPMDLADFVMLHLLGSLYGEGIYQGTDVWTVYPGSGGGPNAAMTPLLDRMAKLFRQKFLPDLLVRHTRSIDSGKARSSGHQVVFTNQMNTVHINPSRLKDINGKTVMVLDDFLTRGFSFECARNLLLQAGAARVISIAISKYAGAPRLQAPVSGYRWDPFVATQHAAGSFRETSGFGQEDDSALASMRDSYLRVQKS